MPNKGHIEKIFCIVLCILNRKRIFAPASFLIQRHILPFLHFCIPSRAPSDIKVSLLIVNHICSGIHIKPYGFVLYYHYNLMVAPPDRLAVRGFFLPFTLLFLFQNRYISYKYLRLPIPV